MAAGSTAFRNTLDDDADDFGIEWLGWDNPKTDTTLTFEGVCVLHNNGDRGSGNGDADAGGDFVVFVFVRESLFSIFLGENFLSFDDGSFEGVSVWRFSL